MTVRESLTYKAAARHVGTITIAGLRALLRFSTKLGIVLQHLRLVLVAPPPSVASRHLPRERGEGGAILFFLRLRGRGPWCVLPFPRLRGKYREAGMGGGAVAMLQLETRIGRCYPFIQLKEQQALFYLF